MFIKFNFFFIIFQTANFEQFAASFEFTLKFSSFFLAPCMDVQALGNRLEKWCHSLSRSFSLLLDDILVPYKSK